MNFRLIFNNAKWIIICKVLQSVLQLVIGMLCARYLGPSNYGLINYAASVFAFVLPITKLGFDASLVNEYVRHPEKEGEIMGTSLVMNLVSALFSFGLVTAFVMTVNGNEKETIIVCLLYSFLLLFQACEMTQYWFQSKLQSKYASISSLVAYMFVSVYKIYILVAEKGVRWFAVSHVIEVAIISILLIICYINAGGKKLSFSVSLGKQMLRNSQYYIWSGLMVILFQQTDRIMLKIMFDETETGYYSAALTCIGITAFVFAAVIDSARPSILGGYKVSMVVFEKRMTLLFSIVAFLSLGQSLFMTLFANPIISILYGSEYLHSVSVLKISVWFVTFGYYGMVRNIWILAEGKQKWLLPINIMGAIINIVGNAVLIPLFGANGAALATVITQFFTNFVLCFLIRSMRPVARMMICSLNPKCLLQYFKTIKKSS